MITVLMAVFVCDSCNAVTMIQEGSAELIKDEDDSADGEGVYNPLGVCSIVRYPQGGEETCTGTVEYRGSFTLYDGVLK